MYLLISQLDNLSRRVLGGTVSKAFLKFRKTTSTAFPSSTRQGSFNRLEKWANRNLIILNKGICRVLHLGWNNPMHQYRLETGWIESNFADECTGQQAGQELAMCACDNSTANYILGYTNRGVASRLGK
ncbi:hypothetical protein QYF61_006267 [Mycteria americana]|uniref:Uncharacterized protein n=1 Tax=Mycteria americana TaxID=33587 RepID=A0AAN7NJV5_MYCAM|nr:hypothetical protein QYF61_006267 [Mycteria americana]